MAANKWARAEKRAEAALRRNRERIDSTARGTRSHKVSGYKVGGGVASRKPVASQ